jgi:hypothetical protein
VSLESLNALRQLNQVREQTATIQQDNIEHVQQSVQQVGTSEAQRTDTLNLEKAKAEYEVSLQAASVKRIEQQLAREEKAVTISAIVAIGSAVFAVGDAAFNFASDLGGKQKLKDTEKDKVDDIDPKNVTHLQVTPAGTSATDNYFVGNNTNGRQTVQLVSQKGDNSIDGDVRSANIGNDDIKAYLKENKKGFVEKEEKGLIDDGFYKRDDKDPNKIVRTDKGKQEGLNENIDIEAEGRVDQKASKINNFEELFNADQTSAKELFSNKSHSIRKSEVDGLVNLVKENKSLKIDSDSLDVTLKATGKVDDNLNGAGNIVKSSINGLISVADTTVPFLQALLDARDKARNTAEELEAAKQKLAAANNKLKELEHAIQNPGYDGGDATSSARAGTG